MRFHGMMLLRDEEDILSQCLDHLLTWADTVYILDTGSTDSSWEIVQDYAKRDKRIVPWKYQPIVYDDNLRSWMFHHLREKFDDGDWVLRLDADEFYHVAPPRWVKERARPFEGHAKLQWYFFRLTRQEVADWEAGRETTADRVRPIRERRRFYQVARYAEPRMFKYRRTMRWPEGQSFPYNAGLVARERLPILHYPHRDPQQLVERVKLRHFMKNLKAHAGGHWSIDDWRIDLFDPTHAQKDLPKDQRTGVAKIDGLQDGPLLEWKPGTELPEQPLYNHVEGGLKRAAMTAFYGSGAVRLFDRGRQAYRSFEPIIIPDEVNRRARGYEVNSGMSLGQSTPSAGVA